MDQDKFKKIKVKFGQYLLLLVFFALLMVLVVFGFNRIIQKNITTLVDKKEQKLALEERINNINKLEKEYNTIASDVEMINNLLPKQDKLVDIIAEIEKMAAENQLDLSIKFEGDPSGHKLKAKFTCKGYFSNLMNFYKSLSTGDILVYIKSIDMTDNNNLLDNAKAIMDVEVYFD